MTNDRQKTVYIAGPMRGVKLYNFQAFDAAKDRLICAGWKVISPADLDRESGFDPTKIDYPEDYDWNSTPEEFSVDDCINRDIAAIQQSDALYMLNGWQKSIGAQAEIHLAKWYGKDIMYEAQLREIKDKEEAQVMTHDKFFELMQDRTNQMKSLCESKSAEYATDNDKLANFKKTAAMKGETPERALWGMVAKHIIATQDFIYDIDRGIIKPIEFWQEKLGDIRIYSVLLEALIIERLQKINQAKGSEDE